MALNETGQAAGDLYWDDGETIDAYLLSRFSLIQFEADFKMVRSIALNWNRDVEPSNIQSITVLGLNHPITVVYLNGILHRNFSYNALKKSLVYQRSTIAS